MTAAAADERRPSALEARELDVDLGGRAVLRGVSLAAEHGQITAVLGPNGAGKTTLIKALVGLLPYRGEISVAGTDLASLSRRARARLVAYVPQRSALDAPLEVATVVGHGRYAHSGLAGPPEDHRENDRHVVERAMDAADISDLAGRSYLELSGGEQRRVLLARALATGARALLLDEPTASLDVGHALALFRLLRKLAEDGFCVVAVLHDLNDALEYTDRALLLDAGEVAGLGPTGEIVSEAPIRRVYGVEPVTRSRLCFELSDLRSGEP